MELTEVLAAGFFKWYQLILLIGLIGVIIFYVMYRRNQM